MRPRFPATKEAINGGGEEEEKSTVRKKKQGAGVRAWLLLNEYGNAQVMEVGKHAIMRRTGLPARDLRALDPVFSYPSSILGRERAIVLNLEHIKAIITAHEVLLLNSRDPAVAPFAAHLQSRLTQLPYTPVKQEGGNSDTDMELSKLDMANDGEIRQFVDENSFPENPDTKVEDFKLEMNGLNDGPKVLPFEFRALEACIEAASSSLESETVALEEEAYPALDELTSKVSTRRLERIRQIKSRLVSIFGRVQRVRDELEHLLDDHEDMAQMYLTFKLMQQLDGISSSTSFHGARGGEEHELAYSDAEDEGGVEALSGTFNSLDGDKEGSGGSRIHSGRKGLDVEELEMLLEAYFVQIDGTLNKLLVLREYVDDTEDYINIMLDGKQNRLLQMGVVLTTTTLIISLFVVLAGVMGMNIRISLFNTAFPQWLQIVIGSTISCIFLDIVAIGWLKHKRFV